MKYIAYYEAHVKGDVEAFFAKVGAKNKEIQVEREKYPDRYPKKLLFQDGTIIDFQTSYGKGFLLSP